MQWLIQTAHLTAYFHFFKINLITVWFRMIWFYWRTSQWRLLFWVCNASYQILQRSPVVSYFWSRGHWTSDKAHRWSKKTEKWESKSNPVSPGNKAFGGNLSVLVLDTFQMILKICHILHTFNILTTRMGKTIPTTNRANQLRLQEIVYAADLKGWAKSSPGRLGVTPTLGKMYMLQ